MGQIFDKLLLSNEILSQEELQHYKKMLEQLGEKKHLGQLLLEKKLIQPHTLEKLLQAEQTAKTQMRIAKKQKYDQKILAVVQQLGIINRKELNACIQAQQEAVGQGETIFLSDLLIAKGYLTAYLVKKFSHQELQTLSAKPVNEEVILDIPQYLRDRFLGKIILKNHILNREQFYICWDVFKKSWPHKSLVASIMSKNFLAESKLKILLEAVKKNITKKYPYLDAQIRDVEMAKLLVKKNLLSPGRLNRCLLQQLPIIKQKKYLSLRKILVDQGYLPNYLFDTILKQYGSLVSCDPPGFLVPANEVKILKREQIALAIQEAKSDIHLIVEEDEMGKIQLTQNFFQHAEVTSDIVELQSEKKSPEPEVEFFIEDEEDEDESQPAETTVNTISRDSFELLLNNLNPKEQMLTPDRIVLIETPEENATEGNEPEILDMEIEDDDLDVRALAPHILFTENTSPQAEDTNHNNTNNPSNAKNTAGSYPIAPSHTMAKKVSTSPQKDSSKN